MWRSEDGAVVLGAVADGHGSKMSMRSHIGARLAIETARRWVACHELTLQSSSENEVQRRAQAIPTAFVAQWQQLVAQDLLRNPLRPHELDSLGEDDQTRVVMDPAQAYGTTLLMAIMTNSTVICAAIGDGDILLVEGERCTPAFGEDERFIANETASLCLPGAVDEFRVCIVERDQTAHKVVVLCTDGVSNAFRTNDDFYKLGSDLLEDTRERSDEEILKDLPVWLGQFSSEGSGDDVTLCILVAGMNGENSRTQMRDSGRPRTELISLEEAKTEPCVMPGASGRPSDQSLRDRILIKASRLLPFSTRTSNEAESGES